jgi:hypothetical protein
MGGRPHHHRARPGAHRSARPRRRARWLEQLAAGGEKSRRSIQIMRMVLRASLVDAVEEGLLRRNPAGRVPMPRDVARTERQHEVEAWDEVEVDRLLAAVADHRWAPERPARATTPV